MIGFYQLVASALSPCTTACRAVQPDGRLKDPSTAFIGTLRAQKTDYAVPYAHAGRFVARALAVPFGTAIFVVRHQICNAVPADLQDPHCRTGFRCGSSDAHTQHANSLQPPCRESSDRETHHAHKLHTSCHVSRDTQTSQCNKLRPPCCGATEDTQVCV